MGLYDGALMENPDPMPLAQFNRARRSRLRAKELDERIIIGVKFTEFGF